MESILRVLTDAELAPELVYRGSHAVTMHIVGFTLHQIGYEQGLEADLDQLATRFLAELSDEYPYMADHVRAHLVDEGDDDDLLSCSTSSSTASSEPAPPADGLRLPGHLVARTAPAPPRCVVRLDPSHHKLAS